VACPEVCVLIKIQFDPVALFKDRGRLTPDLKAGRLPSRTGPPQSSQAGSVRQKDFVVAQCFSGSVAWRRNGFSWLQRLLLAAQPASVHASRSIIDEAFDRVGNPLQWIDPDAN
jgi:hypothetical protein